MKRENEKQKKNCVCHTAAAVKRNHDVNVIWFDRVSLNVNSVVFRQTPSQCRQVSDASPKRANRLKKERKTKKSGRERALAGRSIYNSLFLSSIDGPVAWNNNIIVIWANTFNSDSEERTARPNGFSKRTKYEEEFFVNYARPFNFAPRPNPDDEIHFVRNRSIFNLPPDHFSGFFNNY